MSPSPAPKFKNPRARYNFQGRTCSITGVGSYVPAKVLTNADLEKMVDTSDEWITTRTGIKERRIAAKDEFTSDLGAQAALRAMQRAGVTAEQIDLIIVATITPDMPFPSTACLVQRKIGAHRAAALRPGGRLLRASSTAWKSPSSSSCPAPTTPCWSSARRSFLPLWTGRTATPACCSATARARPSCGIAPTRTAC